MSIEKKYDLIWNEVVNLSKTWSKFKRLFCTSQEIVDKLNKVDPDFAQQIHRNFLYGIIGAICRLNDPAKQGKNKNASLEQLLNHAREITVSDTCDPVKAEDKYKDIEEKHNKVKKKTKIFLPYRNKQVSHLDQEYLLSSDNEEKKEEDRISIEVIDNTVSAIQELIHTFDAYYIYGDDSVSDLVMEFESPEWDNSPEEMDIVDWLLKTEI